MQITLAAEKPGVIKSILFLLFLGLGSELVGQGLVAAHGTGVFPGPFAVGDGVLEAMPGRGLGFTTNDATSFLGAAELPFLLPGNRHVCKLIDNLLAGIGACALFFLRFHNSLTSIYVTSLDLFR